MIFKLNGYNLPNHSKSWCIDQYTVLCKVQEVCVIDHHSCPLAVHHLLHHHLLKFHQDHPLVTHIEDTGSGTGSSLFKKSKPFFTKSHYQDLQHSRMNALSLVSQICIWRP